MSSGCGKRSARTRAISALLRRVTAEINSSAVSQVRYGAIMTTPLK
jgi:hypothetical protein